MRCPFWWVVKLNELYLAPSPEQFRLYLDKQSEALVMTSRAKARRLAAECDPLARVVRVRARRCDVPAVVENIKPGTVLESTSKSAAPGRRIVVVNDGENGTTVTLARRWLGLGTVRVIG